MDHATEFFDRTGKRIYLGDTLQIRLGKSLKHGGATNVKVVKFGKNIQLRSFDDLEPPRGGYNLTKKIASISSIIDYEIFRQSSRK